MIAKNLLRILKSYRFHLINIILFEFKYWVKGFRGNKFDIYNHDIMSDNIPCPYYFLHKIKKKLNSLSFDVFIDLGCGSGRVIDFFNKTLSKKVFYGVEFYEKQYNYCKKLFKNDNNIEIINDDFFNLDILKLNADCFFLNHPIRSEELLGKIVSKILAFADKKKIYIIFVNCNKSTLDKFKKLYCIEEFYINLQNIGLK